MELIASDNSADEILSIQQVSIHTNSKLSLAALSQVPIILAQPCLSEGEDVELASQLGVLERACE